MKRKGMSALVGVTLLFVGFTAGMFLGRNRDRGQIVVAVPAVMETAPTAAETVPLVTQGTIVFPIDLNTADKETLMALPGIGEVYAQRILDYRATYGRYKNVEELLNVEGIGESRLEAILDLVTVGG